MKLTEKINNTLSEAKESGPYKSELKKIIDMVANVSGALYDFSKKHKGNKEVESLFVDSNSKNIKLRSELEKFQNKLK